MTEHDSKPFLAILVGDSLSMPRYEAGIQVEDTYSYSLEMWWRERYSRVITWSLSEGGVTLQHLVGNSHDFLSRVGPGRIDVCIVHLGIVDCAPRPLPYLMRLGLSLAPPILRNRAVDFLHQNRQKLFKLGWSFRFTSPSKFGKIYSDLIQLLNLQCRRVYVINIAPGLETVYRHSPGLKESIVRYNEIIGKATFGMDGVKSIDAFGEFQNAPERYLTADLHITKEAHNWICEQIVGYEEFV